MPESAVTMMDGSLDFSGGVNSVKVTTIQSQQNPGGLARNELAWLDNATVRDGGITPRGGWRKIGRIHDGSALYQGGYMYRPINANPYLVLQIGGHLYKTVVDTALTTDLTAAFPANAPQFNPATVEQAYFTQAEEFLINQAGDGVTKPFFWDGTTLRRSNGITGFSSNTTAGGQFVIDPVSFWVVPAVGASVTIPIQFMYGGLVGNIGTYGVIGTFEVTAFTAVAPYTITLKTVSSGYVGSIIAASAVNFIVGATTTNNPINEIPAATCMEYYMGRVWYAQDRKYTAGDIVQGESGTAAYDFRDSVLKVTENPLAVGGDGFVIPANDGNITAIKHAAAIDAALGQGRLFIFSRRAVYALQVPVTRNDWISSTSNNQPLQTVVQLINGSVGDRCVVAVNGDLFYQSVEPGIRSLLEAVRYFNQWGNIQISANEQRILNFNDRSLMATSTGIQFNSRLLQSALPKRTPQGVVFQALVPMDFIPISSYQEQKRPNWEGMQEGLQILQMFNGDFGGRERAFAVVVSQEEATAGQIELWEFTQEREENGNGRVTWIIETPAYTFGKEFDLKKLVGMEIWADRLYGTVDFQLQMRPDGQACWTDWHIWKKCSPRSSAEDCINPISYPLRVCLESYISTMTMPKPPDQCAQAMGRPLNQGYQFQVRLIIKGFIRIRGMMLYAEPLGRKLYANITC